MGVRCLIKVNRKFTLRRKKKGVQDFYKMKRMKAIKNYSTQYSRLVSYGSTDWASTCLPTQIGRDGGLSGVYGRSWERGRVELVKSCCARCYLFYIVYWMSAMGHVMWKMRSSERVREREVTRFGGSAVSLLFRFRFIDSSHFDNAMDADHDQRKWPIDRHSNCDYSMNSYRIGACRVPLESSRFGTPAHVFAPLVWCLHVT